MADLPLARQGGAGLGRRRKRAPRLPQRLRLDGAGPRAPGDLQGGTGTHRAGHPLRGADGGRCRRGRGAGAALEAAEVALRQLGLRGDDGRDPHRPCCDRPRHDHEDLRLVPRPPRLRDGLDRRGLRPDRRPRRPRVPAVRRRDSEGRLGHDDPRAVQRCPCHGAAYRAPDRRGAQARLRDHGGGHDEPGGHPAPAGLSGSGARGDAPPRHHPDLRRGQDRPLHRGRGRHRALRRAAGHGDPREGARRGIALGRDRRHRRGVRGRRERRRLPGGHVQREPARHGGCTGEPPRGAHARGLRSPRRAERAHPQRLPGRRREVQPARATR